MKGGASVTADEMRQALEALGERLAAQGIHADILIVGGAWMALV